jgi:CelD/BcsL family acetyltransferase involved in cellulose biosynthesis
MKFFPTARAAAPVPVARGAGYGYLNTPRDRAVNATYQVEVVESAEQLLAHVSAWTALAGNALEPNPFYEPWMLMPAIFTYGSTDRLLFALVYRTEPGSHAPPLLCAFFPFSRQTFKRRPLGVLKLWRYRYCCLSTPLVHRDHARPALKAVFEWARAYPSAPSLLDFSIVHGDGPVRQAVVECLNERRAMTYPIESYNRAFLFREGDPEEYVASTLSRRHHKEIARQRRRLAEQGRLESRILEPGECAQPWVDDFLGLEASGWKGREGTAMASNPVDRAWFRAIAIRAHANHQLLMLGLFLDGRPLALQCNFLSGRGGFAFKMAYDEAFAKYSPGVQLEIDNIHAVHRLPRILWMDSCAGPYSSINRLWKHRRTIDSLLISTGRVRGDLVVGALPFPRGLQRILQRSRTAGAAPAFV